MKKPCRIELNNSGSWKLLGKFDAATADAADRVMEAAANLADALNDTAVRVGGRVTLRVTTDDSYPAVLMRYFGRDGGWEKTKEE